MRYLILFLFLATILSCQKEADITIDKNASIFWTLDIVANRGNRSVVLEVGNPHGVIRDNNGNPTPPDYVEIYYGADSSNIKLYKKIATNTSKLSFNNLINDKPYYFYIKIYTGSKFRQSDTVRTIPSTPIKVTELLSGFSQFERTMLSFSQKYISLDQNPDLTIKNRVTNTPLKIEKSGYAFKWAHQSNKLIYVSTITEGVTRHVDKIKLFDADKYTDELILSLDYTNYQTGGMALSFDDKRLYINSNEGLIDKNLKDLWMIDLATKLKTKVGDFSTKQFYVTGRMSAGADGKSILVEGGYNLPPSWLKPRYIYRYNIETKKLHVAIKSAGYSVSFSESPDGKHIAFVSDYTGKDELWLFNTTDQTLKQLTGGDNFDSRNANFQWIDNQSLSMFLNTNTELKLFKMKI